MQDKQSVLIVDDELINIRLVEKTLRDIYHVRSATNGCDAIDLIKEFPPDIIILDVMMPDLSGFDVCRIIKEEEVYADIPVLFLSAADTVDFELLGLEVGGIDYMAKPMNMELLKLRVRNHLESKMRGDLLKEQRNLLARNNEELEATLARVKLLEGMLSICAYCKKIKDEKNEWDQLERYIANHSEAVFSHGICPDCFERQMEIIKTSGK